MEILLKCSAVVDWLVGARRDPTATISRAYDPKDSERCRGKTKYIVRIVSYVTYIIRTYVQTCGRTVKYIIRRKSSTKLPKHLIRM